MGNTFTACEEMCKPGHNREGLDMVCMSCKERFSATRRAFVCQSCKGGFCESCGITRDGVNTCSPCIAKQCNVPPASAEKEKPREPTRTPSPPEKAVSTPPNGGVSPDRVSSVWANQPNAPTGGRRAQKTVRHRKVCILGHTSVGKSAIVSRYVDDKFSSYHNPTVSSLLSKTTTVDGEVYNVSILDTAGQDEYAVFKPQWSIGTHGYVLVYSVTDSTSFEALNTIRNHLLDCHAPDIPIVLCGNKSDCPETEWQVSEQEGAELAQKWKSAFVLCSAKTGANVADVYEALLKRVAVT